MCILKMFLWLAFIEKTELCENVRNLLVVYPYSLK